MFATIDVTKDPAAVAPLDSFPIPPSSAPQGLLESLQAAVGADNVKDDALNRVLHAYGKKGCAIWCGFGGATSGVSQTSWFIRLRRTKSQRSSKMLSPLMPS